MTGAEGTLLILLLILFLGLVVSEVFEKLHVPAITSIILVGAIFGPHGLDLIGSNQIIGFFGFLGVTFLMLTAGLETRVSHLKHSFGKVAIMALVNGLIPFGVGFALAHAFGYPLMTSLVLGTIFVSSSVAIVIPAVKAAGVFKDLSGELIVSTVVLLDAASLIFLAVLFQSAGNGLPLPLPLYLLMLIALLVLVKRYLPKLAEYFLHTPSFRKHAEHEDQLRFIMILLLAVLLVFAALGVHVILGAFLVGLLLADIVTSEKIFAKIHTLGYGLFVPVFYFIIGMEMNLSLIGSLATGSGLLLAVIVAAISAKTLSGYIAGRIVRLKRRGAWMFGVVSTAQLTTTLAATYAAAGEGILDERLTTSVILLSIITTLGAPVLLNMLARGKRRA